MPTKYEEARERYRPKPVQMLFVAKAPPPIDSGRFFYFEEVANYDSLFWETMKVLYGVQKADRERKREFLARFKRDGYYLIDACETPLPKGADKKSEIRKSFAALKSKVNELCEPGTRIVLISKTVYDVCFDALRKDGLAVIN